MKTYTVAILGATGAVGQEMMKVLAERDFPVGKLIPLASARSAGKKLLFKGEEITIQEACDEAFQGVDIVLGAAENDIAKRFADVMYDYFNLVNPDLANEIVEDDADMTGIAREVLDSLSGMLASFKMPVQEQCDCGCCDKPAGGIKITNLNGKRTVEDISVDEASDILDEFLKGFGF